MTLKRVLTAVLGVLLGLSLLGNVYTVSRLVGSNTGRAAFAEMSTQRFEPAFRRQVRQEIIGRSADFRQAVADLRAARDRMYDIAASEHPDPEALSAATTDVRTAVTRALTLFHESIIDAARQRAGAAS